MKARALACMLLLSLTVASCGSGGEAASDGSPKSVVIAYQPGVGYTQIALLREEGLLEEEFPETEFEFREVASGAAVNDGMLSGHIDVGTGGVPPVLIGWSEGIDYRILAPLTSAELWLNTTDPRIDSLDDIKPGMKIAMPAPNASQGIALRKLAEDKFGKPNKLDSTMISLPHPDAVQQLMSKQIEMHMASPPYGELETKKSARTIANSKDAFGPATFTVAFIRDSFRKKFPDFTKRLAEMLDEATARITSDPAAAAELLAKADETDAKTYVEWLTSPALEFTTKYEAIIEVGDFMKKIGLIKKSPADLEDLVVKRGE